MHNYTSTKTPAFLFDKLSKAFLITFAFLFSFAAANAQVPANDEPCNAIALTANAVCTYQTFSTVDASLSTSVLPVPDLLLCGNLTDADIWFKVVMPASGSITVDSKSTGGAGSMSDGAMAIYTGTCTAGVPAFTEIACADDGSSNASFPKLTVNQPAGSTVYIRFYGFGGETGTFGICVKAAPAPPINNNCSGAIALGVNPDFSCTLNAVGTTVAANQSPTLPNPSCGTPGGYNDDVWYTFVATNAKQRISLTNITGNSTAMTFSVFSGTSCTNLVEIGCNTSNLLNMTGLIVGATYYIRVFTTSATPGDEANFTICVGTPPPPPINDECTAAITLPVNPDFSCTLNTNGTTVSATISNNLPDPSCGVNAAYNDDVWYSFVATSTTHRISLSNIAGGTTNMVFTVYSGTCGTLTELGCTLTNTLYVNGLTAGNTYYVRVFTNSFDNNINATFNICIGTPPPPPANDDCTAAVNLTVNPDFNCASFANGTTAGATLTPSIPLPTCGTANGYNDDVWYKFTTVGANHRVALTNITGDVTDMVIVAYSGSCGTLSQVGCAASSNILDLTGLTPATTYYVRVYTNTPTLNQFANFKICIGTIPPPPANDNCASAVPLTVNSTLTCTATTNGTTISATQSAETPNPSCAVTNANNDDVWFTFVATGIKHNITLSNIGIGGTTGMVIQAYGGTCGTLILAGCAVANTLNLTNLVPGNTYYVRVFTSSTQPIISTNFTICVSTPPPPGPGEVCSLSNPYCSTVGPLNSPTGQPSLGGGGVFGCLGSTPNPTWYTFQIGTPGTLIINMSQVTPTGTPIDVDYAVWGPFTSTVDGCTQVNSPNPTITPVSCSYSTSANETATIPNALTGQFYIMLVTNFNGQAGTITFSTPPSGSTATTNCGIVATASNNGPVCPSGSFNLTATSNNPSATFAWVGPAGFTSTVQNPTGIAAPATVGSYTYTVTVTLGTNSFTSSTTLVVGVPAAPTVVSPVTYCQNSIPPVLTATGTNLIWYGTNATGGTGSATAPVPSTTTVGSTTYYVSSGTGGSCESLRVGITVNVVATLPAPGVTSPVLYCQGITATPLTATGTGLHWYTVATGGVFTTVAPTPITTTPGSVNYYVSQTSGTCEGPRAQITITVNPTPAAPISTSPILYCQNSSASVLTATAAAGNTLIWYGTNATGGTGTGIAPTPSTTTAGNTIYYVSQTNGTCEGPRAPITVNITATPTAPAATAFTYCVNSAAAQLTATGTGLLWYTAATGGSGVTTAPTPITTTAGVFNFYVSQTVSGCESNRTQIVVNIVSNPPAPVVSNPAPYCQNSTASALTGTALTGFSLLWYGTNATGGIGTATAPTPATTTVGTTTYYVSQSNGTCEGPRAAIVVTVNTTALAPVVITPVPYCQNATAIALVPNGTGYTWFTSATGGTGAATIIPPTTAGGTTPYYVSQTVGACTGPRAIVNVVVTPTPLTPAVTTPVLYCQNATPIALTATGTSLLWYSNATGGAGSAIAPIPFTVAPGSVNYYVSQSTGTCEGPRTLITVTVIATPVKPVVTTPINVCQNGTVVLNATGNSLLWYANATGGTGTAATPNVSTATAGTFSYFVSQSTTVNSCEGPKAEIVVNVKPALVANAGPDVIINYGQSTQLNGTGTTGGTYLWTANISPLTLTPSAVILNPVATPLQTTDYKLTVTDPTGICTGSATDIVTITVIINCVDVKNAFSPNGDGVNDTWRVYEQYVCLKNIKVTVFNRYGNKVFESVDYRNGWDGRFKGNPLPDGTYYAVLEFTLLDGTKRFVKSDVTILR